MVSQRIVPCLVFPNADFQIAASPQPHPIARGCTNDPMIMLQARMKMNNRTPMTTRPGARQGALEKTDNDPLSALAIAGERPSNIVHGNVEQGGHPGAGGLGIVSEDGVENHAMLH